MENKILLSIIIPFHNRIELLKKTIDSLTKNIDPDYEIILVDDGSESNSINFLKKYLSNRVFYYKINNSERGYARNFGASKANGIYLNFFDSDDIAYDNHVNSSKEFIKKNNFPKVFSNSYLVFDSERKKQKSIIFNGILNNKIFIHNILSCNAVFIKKDFFINNKFSENYYLSGSEDWDLWLRLANKEKFLGNKVISSVLNNHINRSTKKQTAIKIIKRLDVLNQRIINKKIINLNNKNLKSALSEIYSFRSLTLSSFKKNKLYFINQLILSLLYRPSRIIEL